MKKLSFVLALAVIIGAFSFSATAADAPTAVIDSVSASAGDEITLNVSVKNNPGVVGAQLFVGYDANVMSFVSAKAGDGGFYSSLSTEQGANPVKIVMANLSLAEKAGDFTAATLTFKVADAAKAGAYNVSLSVVEAYDSNIANVAFTAEGGVVTVNGTADAHTHSFTETAVKVAGGEPSYTVYTCSCGHTYNGNFVYNKVRTEVKMTIDKMIAYVNGVAKTLDAAPVIKNDSTMLPIRFVADSLGATVGWDGTTSTVTVSTADKKIEIVIGAPTAKVNGSEITLLSPAFIDPITERTYLPVRFVSENLGATVGWDAPTRTVTLTK